MNINNIDLYNIIIKININSYIGLNHIIIKMKINL